MHKTKFRSRIATANRQILHAGKCCEWNRCVHFAALSKYVEQAAIMFFNTNATRTKYIVQMGTISVLPSLLLMSCILWILSRFIKSNISLAIISAVIWALLHSLNTPIWGLCVLWPFFVFSCAYLAWRKDSWTDAFVVTWGIHAFQNILPGISLVAGTAS